MECPSCGEEFDWNDAGCCPNCGWGQTNIDNVSPWESGETGSETSDGVLDRVRRWVKRRIGR